MDYYVTDQGDTWDLVSYRAYGTEKYTGLIMDANMQYIDIFVFDAGVRLDIPKLPEEENDMPDWRE